MLQILKSNSLKDIIFKLKLLYIFNVLDIVLTILLINTGFFKEANVVMINVVNESPLLSIIIKFIFVGMLIFFISKRIKDATQKQLKISNYFINSILIFYSFIIISHLIYILLFVWILIFL